MSTKAIIIANQTQARFLVWDNSAPPEESNHPLQDIQTLDNPITTTSGKEVWANLQSGRNRGTSSQAHGYDDHRQNHLDEFERRFCNAIATQALALIDQYKIRTVILAAPPQVLGSLRRETEVLWPTTQHSRIDQGSGETIKF